MIVTAQSFGSGSSGNGFLVTAGPASILIDCGIGPRPLAAALRGRGVTIRELSAVFVTHEHDDHVRGLAAILCAGVPVHCSRGTALALGLTDRECVAIAAGEQRACAGFRVTAVSVAHDAAEPMGYVVEAGQIRICLITDLGSPHPSLAAWIAGSDLIVLEANHDEDMLRSGPYPPHLKRRVASDRGHLSNANCGEFLRSALRSSAWPRTIWLAHLSATNNHPELARATVEQALGDSDVRHEVAPLPRREAGPIWRSDRETAPLQLAFAVPAARP